MANNQVPENRMYVPRMCDFLLKKCLIFLLADQNYEFLHFFRAINLRICKKCRNFAPDFVRKRLGRYVYTYQIW